MKVGTAIHAGSYDRCGGGGSADRTGKNGGLASITARRNRRVVLLREFGDVRGLMRIGVGDEIWEGVVVRRIALANAQG